MYCTRRLWDWCRLMMAQCSALWCRRFKLLPYWHTTADGLAAAARAGAAATAAASASPAGAGGCPGYVQDGVYLRHAEGHYSQGGGCTPLALLWKDASCSRYVLVSLGLGLGHSSWGHSLTGWWRRAAGLHVPGNTWRCSVLAGVLTHCQCGTGCPWPGWRTMEFPFHAAQQELLHLPLA
jgi:hypothetical protein